MNYAKWCNGSIPFILQSKCKWDIFYHLLGPPTILPVKIHHISYHKEVLRIEYSADLSHKVRITHRNESFSVFALIKLSGSIKM